MHDTSFNYIIVGAGTAGCLLANRLSENPSCRVLLIEAGKNDSYPWIHIPVGYLYCIGNPRTDWMYKTEPDNGLNGRSLLYPRGKSLGGCSSINGMIYMRGQARDYDRWAELTGEPEWNWRNVLKDFMAHEDHYRLDASADSVTGHDERFSNLHGHGGEWRIEKQRLRWDVLDSFADAMEEYGVDKTDDFNGGDNSGVGYFDVNQRAGWRWNTSKAFLRAARNRKNLTVWTEALVEKLTFVESSDGSLRCSGVQVRRKGASNSVSITAERETILSAGAINTPQILQISGIGPAGLLKSRGVPIVLEAPNVGENLQDHLQIRAVFKIKNALTLNTVANSLFGKASIALEYAFKRTGPMSMSPSQLGAFTRSDPSRAHANLQYHVQPLSLEAFGDDLHDFPAITVSVCNLNPTSRGHVFIKSSNPRDAPQIVPNYLATDEDRQIAAHSLRQVRDVMKQPAMFALEPEEHKPGVEYQSDVELARLAGDIATTIFHPVGTVKMGHRCDKGAVLDPQLKVKGVDDLRVVDASVMPEITSGNTNSPTLMIAEKAARWILSESR